jgi:hypothetical protein
MTTGCHDTFTWLLIDEPTLPQEHMHILTLHHDNKNYSSKAGEKCRCRLQVW